MTLNDIIKFAKDNNIDFDSSINVVANDYDTNDDSTWSPDYQTNIVSVENENESTDNTETVINGSLILRIGVDEFM